jgi:hypothetical protein
MCTGIAAIAGTGTGRNAFLQPASHRNDQLAQKGLARSALLGRTLCSACWRWC